MLVYDSARKPVTLGPELSRGGEGAVYPVPAQPGLIAKLYTHPPQDYADKLAWMKNHPPDDPGLLSGKTNGATHASIAWPLDLLYNPPGQLAGYLMPHITNAASLLGVFNPRIRARILPGFDWRYQHRTARNLAKALKALHDKNYVVGDLNESNVLVTPSALVTLIDTDSFQVHAHGRMFYCPVGKPEYTPPELQGKTFRDLPRKPEHDCFGLGVLVFQLLMDGSHPFRAQWLGAGDPPSIEDRIKQGWYPYMSGSGGPVAPPPNMPPLNILHPRVVELFQRCFVDGHTAPRERPTPDEWVEALDDAEKALIPCANGHIFSVHLRFCPRCNAPNPHPLTIPGMDANSGTATRMRSRWQTVRRRHGPNSPSEGLRLPRIQLPDLKIPASIAARGQRVIDAIQGVAIPLWVGWMIATIITWLAGALIVDPLSARASDASAQLLIATVYGGIVGLMQWLVARRRLREAPWWAFLTALAITAGTIIDRAFGIPLPGSSTILLMAATQAALLYSRAPGLFALAWLLVNSIAWLSAIVLMGRLPASIPATMHTPLAALTFGLLTGVLMPLFLRGTGRYASTPLMQRLQLLGIGWRDIVKMIAVLLLIVGLAGFILQPCNAGNMLKLGQCVSGLR